MTRDGPRRRLPSRACRAPVLRLIRFYQHHVAPLVRSRSCRFRPTCSHYAYEAIDRYGLMAGGVLAYRRLRRCHPGDPGGDDPVPRRERA
jgi:uncharacterized protein